MMATTTRTDRGFLSAWGADLFASVRSVIDTGRHQDLTPFQTIHHSLDRPSVVIAA